MVPWWWMPATAIVSTLLTWWLTANACQDETERRWVEGIEKGRQDERLGLDDPVQEADRAISQIQRVGRLRAFARTWTREDYRKERVRRLVDQGAGR